jgi:O-acetyl-ADP-ribose deacetylase (regulator of RNase III)
MTATLAVAIACVAMLAALWRIRPTRPRTPRPLQTSEVLLYRVLDASAERQIGIVTGDVRRARCAQVWVNPENTAMRMSRVEELSVSAIIRYEGARRDGAGRVVVDLIADELDRRVGSRRPVPAGTVIITGAGDLVRFGVRYVAHSAAVQGEPGGGFHQIREVGRCVTAVLAAVDRLNDPVPVRSVLFPLLGAGQGGGDPAATAKVLVGAATDYFAATPASAITTVYLLAYTDIDLVACRTACHHRSLDPFPHGSGSRVVVPAGAVPTTDDPAPTLPPPAEPLARKTLQLGFSIDVVGFGGRSARGREAVQHRLLALLSQILADAGTDLDHVDRIWQGDGASVYLPSDVDPTRIVTSLVDATIHRLTEDNRRHADRIRLRMAMTVGLLGQGITGYTGPIIVDLARMIDAPALRHAIAEEPDRALAVLLSDYVYGHLVQPGFSELSAAPFRRVEVVVKEFAAPAWLWVPQSG